MRTIVFQTGGPFHPVEAQARLIQTWLPSDWRIKTAFGAQAFDQLDDADLYPYFPPTEAHKAAFREFVQSGRPILAFHSGILSYNDWPEYGQLLGYRWEQGITDHTLYAEWKVTTKSSHPIVRGIPDYQVIDELYYNVQVEAGMNQEMHAYAEFGPEQTRPAKFPMVISGVGGRTVGAGKTAYLANGHSLQTFECSALPPLWINTLSWLLER
jgi:uncharacterized protein